MVVADDWTILEPYELADLLGIDRADISLLTTAQFRLPAGWSETWKKRRGALEFKPVEAAFLVGRNTSTVLRWCQGKGGAKLAARRSGSLWRISPAALIACLKRMSGEPAKVVETPAQRDRRARSDKEIAAAMCGTGRRKKVA